MNAAPEQATRPETPAAKQRGAVAPAGNAWAAALAALLFPGLGHLYLRRWGRAVFFASVVLAAVALGVALQGNLYTPVEGRPLTLLATLGCMGMGTPYFVLLYGLGYQGDITGPGYEYGTAFLLGAGLMNLLLVLDAWDVARGRKE